MHEVMSGYVKRGEIPGIVTLVCRRGDPHVDTIGMEGIGGGEPMRLDITHDHESVPFDPQSGKASLDLNP